MRLGRNYNTHHQITIYMFFKIDFIWELVRIIVCFKFYIHFISRINCQFNDDNKRCQFQLIIWNNPVCCKFFSVFFTNPEKGTLLHIFIYAPILLTFNTKLLQYKANFVTKFGHFQLPHSNFQFHRAL